MSWKCDYCGTPQPKGAKLLLVTPDNSWRTVTYNRVNPETGILEAVGVGKEPEAQYKACRTCQGLPAQAPEVQLDARPFFKTAVGYVVHARKCPGHKSVKHRDSITGEETKEQIPCRICELIIRDYAAFPLAILSKVIEDEKPRDLRVPVALLVRDHVIDRTADGNAFFSQRQADDASTALELLRYFEDTNPHFLREVK